MQIHRDRKKNGDCLELALRLEENEGSLLNGYWGSLRGLNTLILTVVMIAQLSGYTKTTELYNLNE